MCIIYKIISFVSCRLHICAQPNQIN
jgi:hypothetical protein